MALLVGRGEGEDDGRQQAGLEEGTGGDLSALAGEDGWLVVVVVVVEERHGDDGWRVVGMRARED